MKVNHFLLQALTEAVHKEASYFFFSPHGINTAFYLLLKVKEKELKCFISVLKIWLCFYFLEHTGSRKYGIVTAIIEES